ncbi:E3 ubiquitin-protein ligase rnf213-alpha-like protein, partial [Lates japonicus]
MAVDTKSSEKASTHLERQAQQPSNVDVSRSPAPEEVGPLVAANILERSAELPQISSDSEYVAVYFHAVTSKDLNLDPEKDSVFVYSKALFGNWDSGLKMSFSRSLGDKRYLVEGRVLIYKSRIHESIPYKYVVYKHSGNKYKEIYEAIYQKDENHFINRGLSIKQDLLTDEDGLCDDGRCKDERNMRRLLRSRKDEAEAVHREKELVKGLVQICQELPQNVKVDFKGLDRKLHQNIETLNLNELMKVDALDGQTSSETGKVTYFNLCDVTRQMASELHDIKDSSIFKMCWRTQVDELSRDQPDTEDTEHLEGNEEIYTLDQVYSQIFQGCYSTYKGLYQRLKSGEVLLEEIDSMVEVYKGKYEDLQKDLDIMCRIDLQDNRKWIRGRIDQIRHYHDLNFAMESAQIIMGIRKTICPKGDFKILERLLQMNEADSLDCIDDTLINAKNVLKDITENRRKCLEELSLRQNFVLWVKEALTDINELKVFVDLASISAGENDLDVDRVACFHDAVLGYSSMLYGLKEDSGFKDFEASLSKLWRALENDSDIPVKLGRKENFAFSDIFPKVFCRPPKEVQALEMKREENADMESDDPLMDDECFKSEAYQRPYQYLTRFYNNNNLDNFTYKGIEGSHAECLQILLIYCGIIDPSWAELRNFVWFLNLQLQDCENSVFCKFEFVGDTLRGFKNFVVEFMILMSKDFATPSLCIADQSPGRQQIDISGLNERDLAPFLIRKRKHTDKMIERLEASGLGYRVRAEETEDRLGSIPLRQLVYRVHVLPPSMIPLVWDFGQLNDSTEKMYIEQIVQRQAKANSIEERDIPTITKCSPHSTPEGIISTFKQCARFQEKKDLNEYISVVVLDEIGLAEDSPKMPLKTLHPLLEEGCVDDEPQPHKRVGFIGISNWALDPAKMNRGIFVSRGDPNQQELIKSAEGICSSDENVLEKIRHLFEPFAKAYMKVCREGRGFFGLRDFYSLIKMVFSITKISNECPTADKITGAVLRNFSGKDDVDVMAIFREELREDCANANITTIAMVEESILAHQVQENRYLLILTKNYAALQILQQIFFSHQIHPEIIFGSSFPKDQEYTQICRNINRVKVCMETGQTVVLLNLQNLYESLYDALNQYYVTLGGQKYVDLGLGTHRVKCRVHKNFRLIVIEEKEVVYEQFPIPLINRLEKHYLDINTVLRNEQKYIAGQLQEWVDAFVSLSSQHSTKKQYVPSDVFIGYHSDTCSSVVLQVTENQSVETDAKTTLYKAKGILLNCATPDSVIRLDKSRLPDEEREHLTKEYVKEEMHRSLGDYIVYHTQQLELSCFFFTEVTTFSRLLTAADTQQLQNVTKLGDIKLLSLQQFDTEYSFLKEIREFLDSAHADKVLIIQTDYEDSHRRNILSSAKYSCTNEINKWTTTDSIKTFVYFVIKLPRIEGGTSYVGFQGGPWRSVHIDDLRRSKEFVSDVHSLKKLRISDLFEDPPEAMETEEPISVPQNDDSTVLGDLFDTEDLVRSCVQSAVSMLRDAEDSGELSTRRIENLLTLLDGSQTHGVFANIVRRRLHLLLEEYEATIPSPNSWVLSQASNVTALQEGGTFLHTLWKKIQAVVIPLLANLISAIDRDCNLDLLLDSGDDIRNLWLEIFGSKKMLHVPYVRVESKVFMVQSHTTGGNTMRCLMPFSWWIKDFLDGLMMQTFRHENHSPGHFQALFLNTPLGSYMTENVNEKMRKEFFKRYLWDFVSMTMKVMSDEELQLLCQALVSCIDEIWRRKRDEDELCLPHIHITYHFYQSRLQNLSRMISLQPEIVSPLRRNQHIKHCPEMVLDVHAAQACVEYLEPPDLDTDALCQRWLKQVKRLQASLELICSQHNSKQYGERCKERLHDVSNGWKRIYILSLFVEHMLLGFHSEENQLRRLVLNHIQRLSRVLQGNSDVKSVKAFQAVIEVLKSCKQGASDQIFRFGHHCDVCLREPQDPVGLPCHHIYCLTCVRANLDAGQTSCPKCRQQLPNDFQPHVSEDIRASFKKNAEFRQRCNGFFIDMLTTVCFKDNTPPTQGVINHLLSYMRVET